MKDWIKKHIRGPRGPRGPAGFPGPMGPNGLVGMRGEDGEDHRDRIEALEKEVFMLGVRLSKIEYLFADVKVTSVKDVNMTPGKVTE